MGWYCDGTLDCPDKSDEDPSKCLISQKLREISSKQSDQSICQDREFLCTGIVLSCVVFGKYSGNFGKKIWTLVGFHGNLVPTKGTSQRDYKLVPSRVHRQSPVKNQPIKHKVDNFYVLTKVPHNTRET